MTEGLEVEVSASGISTGTERLLWDGTMPPFPGLGWCPAMRPWDR
jgi:3-hydroxyethyl bacteriochlorophyllide a dehydrogenase